MCFSPHLCINGSSKVIKEVRSVFSQKIGIVADFFNSIFLGAPVCYTGRYPNSHQQAQPVQRQ